MASFESYGHLRTLFKTRKMAGDDQSPLFMNVERYEVETFLRFCNLETRFLFHNQIS